MVIREAFAFGTPVVVSRIGALPEIVAQGSAGLLFEPSNASHLQEVVASAWQDEMQLQTLHARSRAEFESRYDETNNYEQLINIYSQASRQHER